MENIITLNTIDSNVIRAYPKPFSEKIKYNRSSVIKKGAFGQTYLGSYDDGIVSVKRIAAHRAQLKQSIELQIDLDHDNVVKLYTVEDDEDFWYGAAVFFFTFLKRKTKFIK